jgi:3-oxoacyl-[acyl-carrier-protein] synthase II
MGAVTSLGPSVEATWDGVRRGCSGVGYLRQFDSRAFPVPIGSEVALEKLGPLPGAPAGRTLRFGWHAAQQAHYAASLRDAVLDRSRCGVFVGASTFPVIEDRAPHLGRLLTADGWNAAEYIALCRSHPEWLAQSDAASVSGWISRQLGWTGASLTIQAACASSAHSLGHAFETIARGDLDVILAGGTDSMLSMLCITGFTLLGTLSRRWHTPAQASRPFDRTRDGFVAGEGAAMLVLEELESARARGAPIYAELIGYGSSCDAYRLTDGHPEGKGIALSMQRALASAELDPARLDYLNAHGTSTPLNDRCETKAIRSVFGRHADRLAVSSTKSQIGHLLCAAGAIELLLTVLAVRNGVLPPTINLEHPDPDCDLDYIPWKARPSDAVVAMSNSCGFGGQNASILVRRWEERHGKPVFVPGPRRATARVLVTGLGLISPLAGTARKHYRRAVRGDRAAAPAAAYGGQILPYAVEARIPEVDRRRFISNRMLRKILTRAASFAVVAAGQTLRDAGIRRGDPLLQECGLYAGSLGLDQDFQAFLKGLRASIRDGCFDPALFAERGMAMIDPLFLVKSLPNSGLCGISIEFGMLGPNLNVMNGPVSALQAIGEAAAAIRQGTVTQALAGGYDSLFQLEIAVGHAIAGNFEAPAEFVPGEGAGFLFLEREDVAHARGARIYGEIAGSSQVCRAQDSLRFAAAQAIEQAGLERPEIVFGDASGIRELDRVELDAARELGARFFGGAPQAGYCGVASAAMSAVHAMLALAGTSRRSPRNALAWCTDREKSAALAFRRYEPASSIRVSSEDRVN